MVAATGDRDVTISHQYDQLEESGTLENFRRVAAGESGGFQGMWFQDTDAYKWIEAASYVLSQREDPELEAKVDEVISLIADAQQPDGYLNTYFSLVEPENRWTNLHMMHELYCAGHLIEAAVAHYRATEKETLLEVAIDVADLVDDVFGDEVEGVPGHEEIELALLKLYRVTDETRYLDLAKYFIDLRGKEDRLAWEIDNPETLGGAEYDDGEVISAARDVFTHEDGSYDGRYAQAHEPLREQETVEGHSVRAMYLFAAATDLAIETGEDELIESLERLWTNMTTKRMYVPAGSVPRRPTRGSRLTTTSETTPTPRPAPRSGASTGTSGCSNSPARRSTRTSSSGRCTTDSSPASRSTGPSFSTRTPWRATGTTTARVGSPARAVRRTRPGCSRRWANTSTASGTRRSTSISTSAVASKRRSTARASNYRRTAPSRDRTRSPSTSTPTERRCRSASASRIGPSRRR